MNATELIEFSRANSEAAEFVRYATDDYIACRSSLLNGFFPGFRLGAEAVEKYLKGLLLYATPSHKKKYGHHIRDAAAAASKVTPCFNATQFNDVLKRLEWHYLNRYPNNSAYGAPGGSSTAELVGIDELVLHIYNSLPIPEVAKFRNMGYFFTVCCDWKPMPTILLQYKECLERDNVPLQRVKNSLVERYKAMEEELGCR